MRYKAAAVCLVLAPTALAIATGVDPALGQDQGYGVYRAHPSATQWHSLLLHWAWTLFVPGLFGLLTPIRRRGAVLARIAWVAIGYGLVTFSALMAFDFVILALEQTRPDGDVARVDDALQAMSWLTIGWQYPGLLGWAAALVLAPVAAARGKVISWWTAGAALAGTALYLLFAISPVPVNLAGPLLLIGAYAAAARQLVCSRPAAGEPDLFGAFRRRVGVACLYGAPAAFAVGMALSPGAGDVVDSLRHPVQTQLSALALHVAWVLFIPAMLEVARVGRRFTRVAAGLAVVGLVNLSGLMFGDYAGLATAQVLGTAAADRLNETLAGFGLFTFGWALPGMVAGLVGLMLVMVGAAVDRVAGWWVPAIVVAGFAAFLAIPAGPLAAIGPLVVLVGCGLLARRIPPVPIAADAAPVVTSTIGRHVATAR